MPEGADKGDTVVFSVRMPRALHRRLAAVAQDDDSTVNRAVIVAVRRYVRAWEAKRARASAPGEEPAT